jgi:hypothetical protein
LSRGGRELTPLIQQMADGLNLRKAAKVCRIDAEQLVATPLSLDASLPWELIRTSDRPKLKAEYQAAMRAIGVQP